MEKRVPISPWPEWEIMEKIGEGSFGKVYKAQSIRNGVPVFSAIKMISIPSNENELESVRAENQDDRSVREYFYGIVRDCIQEVHTMEKFHGNPNIVSVEDFKVVEYLDDIGWDIYIRMEYLTSFLEYCSEVQLSEKEILNLGIDICKALEYCQRENIVHRDVKPENIFVATEAQVFGNASGKEYSLHRIFKLGDFGIARELERSMGTMSKKGTFSYMAPEMYRGEKYDRRADIYSLGIVLYKLCNRNRLPFVSLNKQLITYHDKENALNKRMSDALMPAPVDAEPSFAQVILRACAFHEEDRYQSAQELRRDLEAVRRGENPIEEVSVEENLQRAKKSAAFRTEAKEAIREIEPARTGTVVRRTEIPVKDLKEASIENGKQRKKKRKRRRMDPLVSLAVVLALAVVLVFSYYFYLLFHEDNRRNQNENGMENVAGDLIENENRIEEEAAAVEVHGQEAKGALADDLQLIQERVNAIHKEENDYNWVEDSNKRIQFFDGSWQLMKVLLFPETTPDGRNEEFYYWNGQMIFTCVWTEQDKEYYYFKNGELLRWVDANQVTHDEEYENTEFQARGQNYWLLAVKEMERVQNGVSD